MKNKIILPASQRLKIKHLPGGYISPLETVEPIDTASKFPLHQIPQNELVQISSDLSDPSVICSLLADAQNPLKNHSPDSLINLFKIIQSNKMCSRLKLQDWHRLLQNITNIDIRLPIPETITKACIQILLEIKANGITPDVYIYTCLYIATSDKPKMILLIHDQLRLQIKKQTPGSKLQLINNKSIQTLLSAFILKHNQFSIVKLIPGFWQDLKNTNVVANYETCYQFLQLNEIIEYPELISEIHAYIKGRKITRNETWSIGTYERLMNLHYKLGNYNAVEKLFNELENESFEINSLCFATYLKALKEKQLFKFILINFSKFKTKNNGSLFGNESIGAVIDSCINLDNTQVLFEVYEHTLPMINSESSSAFSVTANIKCLEQAYEFYKQYRQKEAKIWNSERLLLRPGSVIDGEIVKFSRNYMPPEPSRSILYDMVYGYGYVRDYDKIIKFFREEVLTKDRYMLYNQRKADGIESAKLKSEDHGNLSFAAVYEGLEKGWRDGLMEKTRENQEIAKELMEFEDLSAEIRNGNKL